jgi:hypothetical protein
LGCERQPKTNRQEYKGVTGGDWFRKQKKNWRKILQTKNKYQAKLDLLSMDQFEGSNFSLLSITVAQILF